MILDDEPTDQSPDPREIRDDDVEKEKTIKKKITTFNMPNNTLLSTENLTISNKKNEEKNLKMT